MTQASVTYIKPNRTDAGAIPVNTSIATHTRSSDGASVQPVVVDPPADDDDMLMVWFTYLARFYAKN